MLIGYARVSTQDQDTTAQIEALKSAGCELIFQEKASGGRWNRPELHRLLGQLRKGDVLILMEKVEKAEAGFLSLTESIDTISPAGRMMMQVVSVFAEFERAMLRERTKQGLQSARQQGRHGGRRPKLNEHQRQEIIRLVQQGHKIPADVARLFDIHPSTVSRLLKQNLETPYPSQNQQINP